MMMAYGALIRIPTDHKPRIIEVDEANLRAVLVAYAMHVEVDEVWYLQSYRDVRDALESGIVSSAREHYAQYGYFEDRLPRPIYVDETWYVKEYPDVAAALQNGGEVRSAQAHFELYGFKEGRRPHVAWSL
jgi:hypothetical protein